MLFRMSTSNLLYALLPKKQAFEVEHFQESARSSRVMVTHDRVGVFVTSFFARGVFVTTFTTS